MSQYARNNPDLPPRFDDFAGARRKREPFGGGVFAAQSECFRAARSHDEKVIELQTALAVHKAKEYELQRDLDAALRKALVRGRAGDF